MGDQQAGEVTHHRFIGSHRHFTKSRERTECKKTPNWLQVDDLYCFLRACLPSSWCFVPIAITEELSLIGIVNGHYTVYLKTKSLPTAYMGWQGMRERKSWALLCFFFTQDYESTFGGACIICAKTQQMNSINGCNMWLGSS